MAQRAVSPTIVRRAALAVAVVALMVAAVAPVAAQQAARRGVLLSSASGPTIDTYSYWDGNAVYGFGRPYVATIGEVITAPADPSDLFRFRFYLGHYDCSGPFVTRGELYQWNGTMATGTALWEGDARSITIVRGSTWLPSSYWVSCRRRPTNSGCPVRGVHEHLQELPCYDSLYLLD